MAAIAFDASIMLPPPSAITKSQAFSLAVRAPAITVDFSGLGSTLSKMLYDIPIARSWLSSFSRYPFARVDFPFDMTTSAFFPGSFSLSRFSNVPLPKISFVGM